MLYLIGLGLGDHKDITVRGLELIRSAEKIFLESYTSILSNYQDIHALKEFYGKDVCLADRETVESDCNIILDEAETKKVAFLVVGDVFGATTHIDLILRAKQRNIDYKVVHNASIISAISCCGLQLYNFGEIVSIPLWNQSWQPTSFIDKIESNYSRGLHTLCLLDIKMKEKSVEAMMRGKDVYEPPRFMTVDVAAEQLLESIKIKENSILTPELICVGLARVGADDQKIVSCTLSHMKDINLGKPLHCLIIAGKLHPLEEDMLKIWTEK